MNVECDDNHLCYVHVSDKKKGGTLGSDGNRFQKWGYLFGMGNYSINRENRDNLASNNRIVFIFLVFNNRTSQ